MNDWLVLLLSVSAGSIFSLIGGFYLIYGKIGTALVQRYAVPFAAGALLAATFFDLLPEALEQGEGETVLLWALLGFLGFFLMERFLRWFHHHHAHDGGDDQANRSLIIIGDVVHNFIDGLAIGAAFLVNPATGVAVTVAVAAHEIPQEIGDFGLLLSKGMTKKKVVLVNLLSALVTVVGAALVFGAGQSVNMPVIMMMALTAGFFLYIAASDIIPSIHQQKDKRQGDVQAIVLLVGVLIVLLATHLSHNFLEH